MSGAPRRTDLSGRRRLALLMTAWCCGLLTGLAAAWAFRVQVKPGFQSVKVWLCLGRPLAWVLCSAVLQWAFPRGFPVAAFFGGAVLSYTAQGIRAGFGSAGWLLWVVFLFPELLLYPFLFFAWLQPSGGGMGRNAYLLAAAAAAVIGLADLCLVMPFVAFLIE